MPSIPVGYAQHKWHSAILGSLLCLNFGLGFESRALRVGFLSVENYLWIWTLLGIRIWAWIVGPRWAQCIWDFMGSMDLDQ